MPVPTRASALLVALGLSAALVAPATSLSQGSGGTEPQPPGGTPPAEPEDGNPCTGPGSERYLCPDLRMATPTGFGIDRRTRRGRTLLRMRNSIDSRGLGPASLRGRRRGPRTMVARQVLRRRSGGVRHLRTGARLVFKDIPGQGPYWKMADAARFELWSVDGAGAAVRVVRTGPKQHYCLRDLVLTRRSGRSPRRRVYPGCSQNPRLRAVTLGTSVGWSDIYPAGYHENWIDVTGLRGTFLVVQTADPRNGILELNEQNNASQRLVRLPSGRPVSGRNAAGSEPSPY